MRVLAVVNPCWDRWWTAGGLAEVDRRSGSYSGCRALGTPLLQRPSAATIAVTWSLTLVSVHRRTQPLPRKYTHKTILLTAMYESNLNKTIIFFVLFWILKDGNIFFSAKFKASEVIVPTNGIIRAIFPLKTMSWFRRFSHNHCIMILALMTDSRLSPINWPGAINGHQKAYFKHLR